MVPIDRGGACGQQSRSRPARRRILRCRRLCPRHGVPRRGPVLPEAGGDPAGDPGPGRRHRCDGGRPPKPPPVGRRTRGSRHPRRGAGPRDHQPGLRGPAVPGLRHPDRRRLPGVRLGVPGDAGEGVPGSQAGQGPAVERLVPAAALRRAGRLCRGRCRSSAGASGRARNPARRPRAPRVGQRGVRASRHPPVPRPHHRLVAAERGEPTEGVGPGSRSGTGGVARAGGAGGRPPGPEHPARRDGRRPRRAAAPFRRRHTEIAAVRPPETLDGRRGGS